MKKFKPVNKSIRNKLLALVLIIAIALIYIGDFSVIDVEKILLIEAIGIDYQDNQYQLQCQSASAKSGEENKSQVLVADGISIADTFDNLHAQTGWLPKLNFCDLIVLGKSAAEKNCEGILNYFFSNEQFGSNALIAICATTADEVFKLTPKLDNSASHALAKILTNGKGKIDDTISVSLKDALMNSYSKSKAYLLPYLEIADQKITAQKAVIIQKNSTGEIIDTNLTLVYNLLFSNSHTTIITVQPDVSVLVRDKRINFSYKVKDSPTVDIDIKLLLQNRSGTTTSNPYGVDNKVLKAVEQKLKNDISMLYAKALGNKNDFLQIGSSFYKYAPFNYTKIANNLLDNINLNITISCKSR